MVPSLPTPVPTPLGRLLRVLLVDDTPADRELAREAFGDHEHAVIIDTCASGERALAFLRAPGTALPDVLLLDLNMPGLSGFEVLAQLKDDPQLRVIPVVILSTSISPDDVERAYTLHASSYLIKTADFQRFIYQVDAFVNFWIRCCTTNSPAPLD